MSLNSEPWSDLQTEGLSSRNKLRRSYRIKQRAVLGANFWRRAREHTKCHLPAVRTQIYLMNQLNRKCRDRIIRVGRHRRIIEQSDVEARTHLRYALHWLQESTNRNPSYTLSSERVIRECRSYIICLAFYLFYKRNV